MGNLGYLTFLWLAWRLLDVKVRTSYIRNDKSNSEDLRYIKRRGKKNKMLACKKGGKEREAAGKSQITKPCSRSLAVPSPSVHSDPLSRKLYTAPALHWPPLWM